MEERESLQRGDRSAAPYMCAQSFAVKVERGTPVAMQIMTIGNKVPRCVRMHWTPQGPGPDENKLRRA